MPREGAKPGRHQVSKRGARRTDPDQGRHGCLFAPALHFNLSQIFDYGNTALEKHAIFYKRMLPLLEFGREREAIDLSKIVLTHHKLRDLGKRPMPLNEGESPTLEPVTEAGCGHVREPTKAYPQEIIEQLNELFGADTTDQDQLTCVNRVIMGKLLESQRLRQQAINNSKEQFASSPDLSSELTLRERSASGDRSQPRPR